jgi:hypothetical protein
LEGGPPRFPQDFSCPAVLGIPLGVFSVRLPGCHRLRQAFPCHFISASNSHVAVPQPLRCMHPRFGPGPRSLAATRRIAFAFSSSGYLDVSVPRVCSACAVIRFATDRVAPFGDPGINGYVPLPQAYRSLSRPSSPLCAKASTVRRTCLISIRTS